MGNTGLMDQLVQRSAAVVLAGGLALTACGADEPEAAPPGGGASPGQQSTSAAGAQAEGTDEEPQTVARALPSAGQTRYAEVDDPIEITECLQAEENDGATVTWLPDTIADPQRHEGLEDFTVEIGGEEVTIPGAPELIIPERVGQAGCVIEYDAPAGCLGAVEISRAFVPGVRIPERGLPEVELPGGVVLEEVVQEAVEIEAVEQPGDSTAEVCITEEDEDLGWGVYRNAVFRGSTFQDVPYIEYAAREPVENSDGSYIPWHDLPGVFIEWAEVPGVQVPVEELGSEEVDGDSERAERGEQTIYTSEGDVLFDTGDYELSSDAEAALEAIAANIAQEYAEEELVLTVEGHTDDVPVTSADLDYADNDELSELRAAAVALWLIENLGLDPDSATVVGRGEDYPRTSNDTEQDRAENRRVVISVVPVAYEYELEYELEERQRDGIGAEGED